MSIINSVTSLPKPVYYLAGFIGAGSLLSMAYMFLGNSVAMVIVALGLIFVFGLLALYRMILGWARKRKANPLSQGISGNAAAAPQGISEPARRARLDDLRRNFEQGVEKFRAAGKNLYSVPWYVLVGEPGSGKTEAIRHCNVGFPPGLQDQLQGAGGTLNMNWWFTNQAIILDTAGRLMFEEVPPGSTNEWNEFLKLLRSNRPNSPLNGMLLVIPVDTLIKDSADQIEKKATKIAQQFDQIQRTLGVRFPVFVIITKCDLLNGFREFFDDLNDPQLQHQIMGWSNPASLDERFDPATVTNHLETVKTRLSERRQHLILDPVNTEDPQGRRVDQVDALYALPDSITKIAPRLRRYLEMIFVAGEWSPKPLFLRGIYFTSSMTEGSALDAELAEVLGVPVDSLPEGRVWRRDRAYFLRDLFVEKVFREKGLVTRASNADKQMRSRRAIVLTVGFLSLIILFALTWLGARQMEKRIGGHRDFWETAAGFDPREMHVIDKNKYSDQQITIKKNVTSIAGFFGSNLPLVQARIDIPILFKPMTWLGGNVDTQRRDAYRALFESTVLAPVYNATREKIKVPSDSWNPAAAAALAQLMKVEYANALGKLPADEPHPQSEIAPLFQFVLSPEDLAKFQAGDGEALQKVVDWIYTDEAGGTKAWPPAALAPGSPASLDAIEQGISATVAFWDRQTKDDATALKSINDVRTALTVFRTAEKTLQEKQQFIGKIERFNSYEAFHTEWKDQLEKLHSARKDASTAWIIASKNNDKASLSDLYTTEKNRITSEAQQAYDILLKFTAEAPSNSDPAKLTASYSSLIAARGKILDAQKKLKDWKNDAEAAKKLKELGELDAMYLASIRGLDNSPHHRFEVQGDLFDMADKMFVTKGDPSTVITGSLDEAFSKIDKDYPDASSAAQGLRSAAVGSDDNLLKDITLAQFAIDSSGRAKKYLLADGVLGALPQEAGAWPAAIALLSKKGPREAREALTRPQVPLVTFPAGQEKLFDEQFAPDAAGTIADRLDLIQKAAADKDAAAKILDAPELVARTLEARKGFNAYRDLYITYWRDVVKDQLAFNYPNFKDFANKLADCTEASIFEQLKNYGDRMMFALNRVGAADEANNIKTAPQVSREESKDAFKSWTDLGIDSQQVRRVVLALQANSFKEHYTVPTARSANDSHAARFWQGLPVAGLRFLVSDGRAEIEAGLRELSSYERFPLAPPGDPKIDLTFEELQKARTALERIRGAGSAVAAAGGGPTLAIGAQPIGQGGMTGVKEVDAQLDLLRGTNLLKDKQEYFSKLDKFLVALPADRPFTPTLSIVKEKLKGDDNAVSVRFSYMVIAQNKKELKQAYFGSATLESCGVDYPSPGDLQFQFREVTNGPIVQTETFPGPWSVFRLMKSPNVKSITRDGTKWTIEYVVTDSNKKNYTLWLALEFKQPVPDLKDWPVPPGAR